MAMNPINLEPKKEGGKGGLFGKLAGGIAGAIGGAFVGQPVKGAMAGAALGGTIGGIADPGKVVQTKGVSTLESASRANPETEMATMTDAVNEIRNNPSIVPDPENAINILEQAKNKRKQLMGIA